MDIAQLGIKISIQGAEEAIQKLERLKKTGSAISENVEIKVTATERAKKEIEKVENSVKNLQKRLESLQRVDLAALNTEQLKAFRSELSRVNAALFKQRETIDKLNYNNLANQIEKLASKHKNLVEGQREFAKEMERVNKELEKKTALKAKEIEKVENSVKNLQKRLQSLQEIDISTLNTEQLKAFRSELSKVNATLFKQREAIDKTTYNQLANEIEKLASKHRILVEGQKEVIKEAERLDRELKKEAILKEREAALHRLGLSYEEVARKIKQLYIATERLSFEKDFSIVKTSSKRIRKDIETLRLELSKLGKTRDVSALAENLGLVHNNLTKTVTGFSRLDRFAGRMKEWWRRFGEVAFGFTVMYHAVNLLTRAMQEFNMILIEGVKESGELVATQAKLSMWISFFLNDANKFPTVFRSASGFMNDLANLSLKTISNMTELTTATDELAQAGVFIKKEMLPAFGDLVDFTKMVAETTGSTTRQIRQELQALMQGDVRVTNILVRTAKNLGILNDEELKNLRLMKDRQKVTEELMLKISEFQSKSRELILKNDVGTAFDKWHKSLSAFVRTLIVGTSEKEGQNVFGAVIYSHLEKMLKLIKNTDIDKFKNSILTLAAGLDLFMTAVEKSITGTLNFTAVLSNTVIDINNLNKEIENLIGISLLELGGAGLLGRLLLGKKGWLIGGAIDIIYQKLVDFNIITDDLKTKAEMFEHGLIFYLLFKANKWVAAAYGTLVLLDKVTSKIAKSDTAKKTRYRELEELQQGKSSAEAEKQILEYFGLTPQVKEKIDRETKELLNTWYKHIKSDAGLKEALNMTRWERYIKDLQKRQEAIAKLLENKELAEKLKKEADSIVESIMTPTEKLTVFYEKLQKLHKYLTPEQELKALILKAKQVLGLKSSVEELSKSVKEFPAKNGLTEFINTLTDVDKAKQEIKKYNEELDKYKEKLDNLVDPTQQYVDEYNKLLATLAKYPDLGMNGYKAGLKDILKNIIDVNKHEDEFNNIIDEQASYLRNLPFNEIIDNVKVLMDSIDKIESKNWFSGLADGLKSYLETASDVASQTENLMVNAFQKIEDAFVTFIKTGKLNFKSFVDSIVTDLAHIAVRQYITIPLAQGMMNTMGGGLPGGVNSLSAGGGVSSLSMAGYIPAVGSFLSSPLPGTVVSYGSDAASLAAAQAGMYSSPGLSVGSALGYGALGGLGYSLLAPSLGLPSNQYSGLTATAGGFLGSWGATAALSGTALGATLGSAVPIVGTIIGAAIGGMLSGLFTNNSPDNSWFYLYTGQRPNAPVDYSVTSKLGTLYMPSKGYDLNDIGFNTAQRKQWEQEFINRIAQLDSAMANAIGEAYINAAREALKGEQFSGVWQTDKPEELEKLVKDFLYDRYSKVFSVVDEGILRFFSKDEDIQQALSNIGGAIPAFNKLSDNIKKLIVDLPDEIISQFEQAGYSDSQIFASLTQSFAVIPDLANKIAKYMDEGDQTVVEAFENATQQWKDINSFVANIFSGLSISGSVFDLKKQIEQNIRGQIGQGFINEFISYVTQTVSDDIFNKLGITSFSDIISGFYSGQYSIEDMQNVLNELVNTVDESADPAIQALTDILTQLGIVSSETGELVDDLNKRLEDTGKNIQNSILGLMRNADLALFQWNGGKASEYWYEQMMTLGQQYGSDVWNDPEKMKALGDAVINYYQALISEIQDEHNKWKQLEDTANNVIKVIKGKLTPQANVLDSIPELLGQTTDDVKEYINNMNEWFNRAFQLRDSIKNLQDAISQTKADIQMQSNLFGKTEEEQISYYSSLINQKLSSMGGSPEQDLKTAQEIQRLVQDRWNIELQALNKAKDDVEKIDSLLEDIGKTIDNVINTQDTAYNIYYQLKSAEKTYSELFTKAQSGKAEDVQKYLSYISKYLDIERKGAGTSREFMRVQYKVQKDLNALKDVSEGQKTTLENQLSDLNEYVTQANSVLDNVNEILGDQYDALTGAIQDSLANIEDLLGDNGAIREGLDKTAQAMQKAIEDLGTILSELQYNIQMKTSQSIMKEALKPYYHYYHSSNVFASQGFFSSSSYTSENKGYQKYRTYDRYNTTSQITMTPMASGGIATSATPVVFGEAGDEAILPLHEGPNTLEVMHNDIKENKAIYKELIREIRELKTEMRIADHEKVKTLKRLFYIEDRRDKYGLKVIQS